MNPNSQSHAYVPLTAHAVPTLYEEQLQKFTPTSIHAHQLMEFDAQDALTKLLALEGQQVIGADFGGDKGAVKLFTIAGGQLIIDDIFEQYVQSTHGDGYLEILEATAVFATPRNIPVGISWGAPLEGTKPVYHPKAKNFLEALQLKYDGDFRNLLPTLRSCINDGPAGLISGAIEASRTQKAESVLFPINGGGLGMAVLANNHIYSTEAGHVESLQALNTYNQVTPCGVFDATYVCIETLGANKAGIEAQYQLLTGSHVRAKEIEDRYIEGEQLGGELYDHSALVVSHMIEGTARAFDIDLSAQSSLVVGHGGAFKFPHYGARIQQILSTAKSTPVNLIMTNDFGAKQSNACLDGAAMAALVA